MLKIANFNQLIPALELNESVRPLLIGIDGRPCSGKSTLADMLIEELSAEGLFLDDFFIPQKDWPNHISPAFPFPYFRYEEFSQGVRNLFSGHVFEYQPYDWTTSKLGEPKIINPKNIIIVEGVSVLSVELEPYFYKKIFVMSMIYPHFNRHSQLRFCISFSKISGDFKPIAECLRMRL